MRAPAWGGVLAIISDNEINNNDVAGDLIVGGIVVKVPAFDIRLSAESLRKMIERHESLKEDDPHYQYVLEELQSNAKRENW